MLIDYHCHVNFRAFKNDADEVIKRALGQGVFMILVGSQIDTSKRAIEMAKEYGKGVYAAVALHPIHLEQMQVDVSEDSFATRAEVFDFENYRELARNSKVVAIGECGLDYFHNANEKALINGGQFTNNSDLVTTMAATKQRQHGTLRQHLDLASELNLPVILHCRGSKENPEDAYLDMLAIIKEYVQAGKLQQRGSLHCFMSTLAIAQQFIDLGFYIGFTGVITFPRPKSALGGLSVGQAETAYAEVAGGVPMNRILVETDAPYLAPVPMRGKRNEPAYVRYVAEKIAQIKKLDKDETEKQLFENTLKLFSRIPKS